MAGRTSRPPSPSRRPAPRSRWSWATSTPSPGAPQPGRPSLRSPRPVDSLRYVVAVGVAGALAAAVGIGHPWWAMVAAAAPLSAPGRQHQVLRAGHRIAGTTLGLLPAAALLSLGLEPVPIVLVVVALQVVTELLVPRNYALALLFITPMALLMGTVAAQPSTRALIVDRGVETAIGALVAITLVVVEHRHTTK
ncbi:FUSC family protein [Nocardioides iriomotensis]|uniref:FUSC family protein n=1 Tax=Nocardioides iriomotensis TaxID=715784 RepID=A0A4Q5J4R1_9ACTN|nr:FUSC family protein [Nocardioides iriomotensis]